MKDFLQEILDLEQKVTAAPWYRDISNPGKRRYTYINNSGGMVVQRVSHRQTKFMVTPEDGLLIVTLRNNAKEICQALMEAIDVIDLAKGSLGNDQTVTWEAIDKWQKRWDV